MRTLAGDRHLPSRVPRLHRRAPSAAARAANQSCAGTATAPGASSPRHHAHPEPPRGNVPKSIFGNTDLFHDRLFSFDWRSVPLLAERQSHVIDRMRGTAQARRDRATVDELGPIDGKPPDPPVAGLELERPGVPADEREPVLAQDRDVAKAASHQSPERQIVVRGHQRIPALAFARARGGTHRDLAQPLSNRIEHRLGRRQRACAPVCQPQGWLSRGGNWLYVSTT